MNTDWSFVAVWLTLLLMSLAMWAGAIWLVIVLVRSIGG